MARFPVFLGVFAAVIPAFAASAQDQLSPIAAYLSIGAGAQPREDRRAMAQCVADYYPEIVQQVMRKQDASLDIRAGKHALLDMNCAPRRFFRSWSFTVNNQYYSYMAEFLLTSDYVAEELPDVAQVPALDHPLPPAVDPAKLSSQYRDAFAVARWQNGVDVIAECVARAAPKQVFALATTKPDSEREAQLLAGLRERLENCKSAALSPSPPNFIMRAALSENLYRLIDAADPVTHKRSANAVEGRARPH